MSITSNEIKLMKSSSVSAGGIESLGGAISATEVVDNELHNLFDKVSSDESLIGDMEYRCAYIQNTNALITLEATISYIAAQTASPTTVMWIGVGTSLEGQIEQVVPDESTEPVGVVWSEAPDVDNSILLGDIPAGSHRAIWFRRVVELNTLASPLDGITLTTRGSTV